MARFLRALGLTILSAATLVLVAGEAGTGDPHHVDVWFSYGLRVGGALFLSGVVLSFLAPFGRMVRQGRCIRCRTPIERGQTYCHEHLTTAVREFRDHVREGRQPTGLHR